MKKTNYQIGIEIILLSSGIIGLLGSFFSALLFPPYYVYIIFGAVVMGCIRYINLLHERSMVPAIAIKIVIGMLAIFFLTDILWLLLAIKDVIDVNAYLNFTNVFETIYASLLFQFYIMGLIAVLIVKFMLSIITSNKRIGVYVCMAIVWLVFPYFIRHSAAVIYMYISAFFLVNYYIYKIALIHLFPKGAKTQMIVMIAIASILCICHFTLESNSVFISMVVERFEGLSYLKDSQTSSTVMQSAINEQIDDVQLPTGNISLNKSKALEVDSTKPFTGYLRGYSMSTYEDNKWKSKTDYYYYPSTNFYSAAIRNNQMPALVKVKPFISHSYEFIPYHSTVVDMRFDSYVLKTASDPVMYEVLIEDTDNKVYATTSYDYTNVVKEYYLDIDLEIKRILEKYLQDKGYTLSNLYSIPVEEKIKIIDEVLENNTSYSLTPGRLPNDRDFVDYFLNDTKKGSCTHYATTGALFLRLLNVPTRYVSGYVVSSSDFNDGKAVVTNNRAHAWIEVYDVNYGWYPVDMTPSSGVGDDEGTRLASMLDEQVEEQSNNASPTTIPSSPNENTPVENEPSNQQLKQEVSWVASTWNNYKWYIVVFMVCIALLFLQQRIRYSIKVKKYQQLQNNQKICQLYAHLSKFIVPSEKLTEIALRARFSNQLISDDKVLDFEKEVIDKIRLYYTQQPWYKKIYGKVVIVSY